MSPVTVHHVDDYLLVVEKPAGLLSVPGRSPEHRDCLIARAQADYPDALTVHRLDQVTSGLVVIARGAAIQRALSMQFEHRMVDKVYEALVEGVLADDDGEIDLPLIVDWPNRPRQKVDPEAGKPAFTRWRRLSHDVDGVRTRLALEPVTGRTHQLRVHLASIGHPIVGDVFYGASSGERVCLHATRLAFTHPMTGVRLAWESPATF